MRTGARRSIIAVVVLVAVLFAVNTGRRVAEGAAEQATDAAFYSLPATIPAAPPGTIIRSQQILSAPFDSTAWRVVYHSRDQSGDDIAVSGLIVVPDGPAPARGRTIVSWAHPTTGGAAHCAPSLGVDPFLSIEGVHELLAAGYVVAATDYQGMGVAGASSYLLGIPEANSVLDVARAARNIPGAGTSDRIILWGHSQGGQAALFAAERAHSYAPELHLEGVAVAAPAANLNALMTNDILRRSGVTIASYAFPAYEAAYASRYTTDEIDAILTPAGLAATPKLAALCLLTQSKQLGAIADPLIGKYVKSNPATTEPWQTMLRENSAGGKPITVPVFVGQGLADTLVEPSATRAYVTLLCSQGARVAFHEFPGITHALAAYASIPSLLLWLADVDSGRAPADSCPPAGES
jgi:alpha-beta hydrolase superfamily lysophospholipase